MNPHVWWWTRVRWPFMRLRARSPRRNYAISWDASVGGGYKHGAHYALTKREAQRRFADRVEGFRNRVRPGTPDTASVILVRYDRHTGLTTILEEWTWPSRSS